MTILNIHVPGATPYEIGDEIWQESLTDAIRAEAEIIAAYAGADLLESPDQTHRDALRDRLTVDMTAALAQIGDHYRSPDSVLYSLTDQPALDASAREASLTPMSCPAPSPTVEKVLRFEDLPLGSLGTRRAVVRWSDGTASETTTWYRDEILSCEGDHGKDARTAPVSPLPQRPRLALVVEWQRSALSQRLRPGARQPRFDRWILTRNRTMSRTFSDTWLSRDVSRSRPYGAVVVVAAGAS